MLRPARFVFSLALALPMLAMPALAGDGLGVNSTLDLPDADLRDGICDADLEAEGLQITLRAAVMHANATPGADTITLPAGLYKLTRGGFDEQEAVLGDLDVTDDLTIVGAGWTDTIVDGRKAKDRVFDLHEGSSLVLEGFTVRRGAAPFKGDDDQRGGGIQSEGDLTLRGMLVTQCKTGDNDGAGVSHQVGSLLIEDSLLTKNRSGDDGAGLDISDSGPVELRRVTFSKNRAKADGGAFEASVGAVNAENCTFSANKASFGGAIALEVNSDLTLVNCTLVKNRAKSGSGLFDDLSALDLLELANCIVANNAATNYAGNGITSLGGNLDSGTSCGFDDPSDLQDADPRLEKLAGALGQTPVHALRSDSPCIDAGNDRLCPPADQLGQARVDVAEVGSALCDIGASEFQP